MAFEAIIKAIGDVGTLAVFVWLVLMFQKGDIISRVTVEKIIEEVVARTISETSARLVTAVNALLDKHSTETTTAHKEILVALDNHDTHVIKVERDVEEMRKRVERAKW